MKNRADSMNMGRVFLLLVLLLASCSTSPAVKYYTLNPSFDIQPDNFHDVSGDAIAIGVGPVELPKFLDRPQIMTRKNQYRVMVSEFHRWAGPFSEDFLRILTQNISMLLPAERVVAYPWTGQFSPTYRITLTVDQFDGQFGGDVVLNVTWFVWNQNDANEPVVKHTLIKEPVSAENYDALVEAYSRATATLSRAIADELARASNMQ